MGLALKCITKDLLFIIHRLCCHVNYDYFVPPDQISFILIFFNDGRSIATLRSLKHFASKYKSPSCMDYRVQGSHARGVYRTQGSSRIGTARVIQEAEADTRMIDQNNSKRLVQNQEGRNVGTKGIKSQTRPNQRLGDQIYK